MIGLIPAEPDVTLIDRFGDIVAIVVGWQLVQGSQAFPVFAYNQMGGVLESQAIRHANGHVTHPASRKIFVDMDAWTAFAEDLGDKPVEAAAPKEWPSATEAAAAVKQAGKPATPATGPIKFGTKTYATKSFWKWADTKCLFEVEKELPYPNDDRVEKIKRDEFFELRKGDWDVIDPHAGVVEDEPATEEAPAEEPEEDDMDVV